MPRYLIERTVPGASRLSEVELKRIACTSCKVIDGMPQAYQWLETYVAGDKFYCVHDAPNEDAVREHARRGGFPIDRIEAITAVIGPGTAE